MGEKRVAQTPETISTLIKSGFKVNIESNAGNTTFNIDYHSHFMFLKAFMQNILMTTIKRLELKLFTIKRIFGSQILL